MNFMKSRTLTIHYVFGMIEGGACICNDGGANVPVHIDDDDDDDVGDNDDD